MLNSGANPWSAAILGHIEGGTPNPIAAMFSNGEKGGWWDPSDLATVFQDTAGTIPAGANDPVALIRDRSGNGLDLVQATTAQQPILQTDGTLWWLEFDANAISAFASSADLDLTSTASAAVFNGYRVTASGFGCKYEVSDAYDSHAGSFTEYVSDGGGTYSLGGNATQTQFSFGGEADVDYVSSCRYAIADGLDCAASIVPRLNGAAAPGSVSQDGPLAGSAFGSWPLYVGARQATMIPISHRLYGMVIVGRLLTSDEITAAEAWLAAKSGVTL